MSAIDVTTQRSRNRQHDEEIIFLYVELGYSMKDIGKEIFWSEGFVRNRLIWNGIEIRRPGGNHHGRITPHKRIQEAVYLYEVKGLNSREIAEGMGVCASTVLRYLDKGGVKRYGAGGREISRCKYNHKLTPDNVYIAPKTGKRRCKICKRKNNRRWARGAKAAE